MKESNFYSDEFEQLIKEKTEQYKMYPSEQVWKGIHGSLHTKRKWFFGSMSILVTGILFFAAKQLITPSAHTLIAKRSIAATNPSGSNSSKTTTENTARSPFATLRPVTPSSGTASHTGQRNDDASYDPSSGDQPYKGVSITITNPVTSQPDLFSVLSPVTQLPAEAPALPGIPAHSNLAEGTGTRTSEETATTGTMTIERNPDIANLRSGLESAGSGGNLADNNGAPHSLLESMGARNGTGTRNGRVGRNGLATVRPGQEPIGKGEMPDSLGDASRTSATTIAEAIDRQRINWLQDYAVYSLTTPAKGPRTYLQLTLSPTVNYRTLSGGDFSPAKIIVQNVPVALMHPGDAKNYVDHSPALGFELGGSLLYRVTRNLSIKGGLQFNFSRYKINAYASSPQQATIALNSYYGYYLDSITSITNIRNFGGKTQVTLNNDYYQLSAPIGLELRVLGNERLQFNVGATIQPTYLLNTNSYMLTSDYTNYTKEPSLFRRWNVNGGLEAFLTYKTSSGIRWQIGPEFRYQLLSTYNGSYPIHENLKGYGIKIGITKVIP
jgi:hypothetical protein